MYVVLETYHQFMEYNVDRNRYYTKQIKKLTQCEDISFLDYNNRNTKNYII